MSDLKIIMTIRMRWWVPYYLRSVAAFAILFGCTPDEAKLRGFILRYGLKVARK